MQIASVCACPRPFACFSAASVSAVSPDCETTTTSAAGCGHAVAIPVFARDLDRAGNAGERLDPLLRDERRVVAGAAGQHQHAVDSRQHGSRVGAEQRRIDAGDGFERVRDGARLLEDLLLHEVAVRAQLDRSPRRFDRDHGPLDALAARIVDRPGFAAHVGNVAILEVRHPVRDRKQRGRVGREEMVVGTDAHDQRAAGARADDASRLARRDHRDRVGAVELGDRHLHGAQQVAAARSVPVRVDEMRDDFRIRLRDERIALGDQPLAQRLEILDDAVVDRGDLAMRRVRMRVRRRGRAVRRPARMRNAGQRRELRRLGLRREIGHARGADEPPQLRRVGGAVDDGKPGGIVAAILEPADAVDQDRDHVARR